jgi:crotonobetainyl-CoA:carnitine CoA-transferase CaiB-like acyl-CoA transferase
VTGALDGILVLDLSRNAPGPFCTMILGDLGADVIAIHDPRPVSGRRDEAAAGAVDRPQPAWRHSTHDALARNKRSLGLDLKDGEARGLFYRLAEEADVVVEEMRPGAAARLGVDYETLAARNSRLVYCSLTGYGQTGPYARLAGHDLNYVGQGGALALIGANGRPVIPQNLLADYAGGGLLAALGVLAALLARERTGRGQHVDAAMADGVTYLLAQHLSAFFGDGIEPEPGRSTYSGGLPFYAVYECADGGFLTIASLEPWFYAALCHAVGRDDLIGHAWDEARQEELRAHLEATFRTRPRDEWFALLNETDQCAGRVLRLDELDQDPQVRAREMVVELAGGIRQIGIAPKLSATPGSIRRLAPSRGEHADEILAELGVGALEIAQLRERGAVG